MLDELRLHYLHAHQIATRADRDAVAPSSIPWWAYQRFMNEHEKQISEKHIRQEFASLDSTPYRDAKDFAILQRRVRKAN